MHGSARHRFAAAARGAALAAAALAGGCADTGHAPVLDAVDDQTAVVGQELVINLRATEPDGDEVEFSFSAPQPGIGEAAELTRRPDGTAVFRWTPLAADVGTWFFDFTVSDDDGQDTVTAVIDVTSAGEGSAPIIREPLGSGTTLDLAIAACLDLPIVVEDPDDAQVGIDVLPLIDGAEIVQDSGLAATWTWCPSKDQLGDDRYPIVLSADDGKNPATLKNYLVVLRSAPKQDCPGEEPHVGHVPKDVSSVLDLSIEADIADDQGLQRAPLLYFSLQEPKQPIDFSTLDVVEMELVEGDMTSGSWRGRIPNPVASQPEGSSASVHYIISVADNDDADGDCDHIVDAPAGGTYVVKVTHGGGDEGAGPCEPCSADVQCGDDGDLCTAIGGDDRCASACETDEQCAGDETCAMVTSVDGVQAMQCVPDTGSCEPIDTTCEDDAHEDDDTRGQADDAPVLPPGEHEFTSCPAGAMDDEDWFRVEIGEDATLSATLDGGNATDLELALYDGDGDIVAQSAEDGSHEALVDCLVAGTYYLRVHTFDTGENQYTLAYELTEGSCGGGTCQDDDFEPDDAPGGATYAEVWPDGFSADDRALCSGDDDHYRVELYTGETIVVDLTFSQTSDDEDLDLHFLGPDHEDLTPCSEAAPSTCSAAQGQSVTSNEHYEHTVTQADCEPCDFWVVVHGWDGAANDYDIEIALD